jgi:hypothetical protein
MGDQLESKPESAPTGTGFVARFSFYVARGLRYWEPRRLVYNGVLSLVVLAHFLVALPISREKLSIDLVLGFFFLAVLANIAYCAVYLVDLFVQFSGLDTAWRWGRMVVLIIGTAFAATVAHFFAKEIFGA